jgi:hypothetical protein
MRIFSKKHNQAVRNKLAEQGTEMTPEELEETRKAAFANIRKYMAEHGYETPDSDEELFALMLAARKAQE